MAALNWIKKKRYAYTMIELSAPDLFGVVGLQQD